jgi:hypothetical protein
LQSINIDVFLLFCIFFNFFHQCFVIFIIEIFLLFGKFYSILFFVIIVDSIAYLIFISDNCLFFCIELFIIISNDLLDFSGVSCNVSLFTSEFISLLILCLSWLSILSFKRTSSLIFYIVFLVLISFISTVIFNSTNFMFSLFLTI